MNNLRTALMRISWATVGMVFVLTGCAVGPNYHPPTTKVPAMWSSFSVGVTNTNSFVTTEAPEHLAHWWRQFQDPKLTALIEEALQTNLDVKLAETRLREARASRGIIVGGLWPNLTASAGYDRANAGNNYSAGLGSAWELDVFGGIRRNVESANALVQAAHENLRDAQVLLASEVALNYIQLRSDQEQIAIAQENLKADRHSENLTRQKLAVGFASALDVANASAQVATTESAIPVLQTSVQQSIYALSVLLARPPGDLLGELSKEGTVPVTPPEIPAGVPSDLLRRRPDVRSAEAQLHSATAQIGVATADFFPKFSLTGSVNYQSDLLRTLFAGANRSWAVGPQVTWPIFEGGSIAANVQLQKALRDEAYITYKKTVLTALQDVENALTAFANEWEHRKALLKADEQNRRALDLSTLLYSQGTSDFLTVLVAERSVYASQSAVAQSKQAISSDLVALYKALGGGWDDRSQSN